MEQRHFSRVRFTGKAEVNVYEDLQYMTEVLDLSLQGALIRRPPEWPSPSPEKVQLTVHLDQFPLQLNMEACVAHESVRVIGLKCLKIDIVSVQHLRRLLELNLGDADQLKRELSELTEEH